MPIFIGPSFPLPVVPHQTSRGSALTQIAVAALSHRQRRAACIRDAGFSHPRDRDKLDAAAVGAGAAIGAAGAAIGAAAAAKCGAAAFAAAVTATASASGLGIVICVAIGRQSLCHSQKW